MKRRGCWVALLFLFWLTPMAGWSIEAEVLFHLKAEAMEAAGLSGRVTGLCFTPDGSRLVAAQELPERRCGLVVLDNETGRSRAVHEFQAFEVSAFSPDREGRKAVLLLDFGRRAAVLDLESGSLHVFYTGSQDFRFKAPVWVLPDMDHSERFWTRGYFKLASGGRTDEALFGFDVSSPSEVPFVPRYVFKELLVEGEVYGPVGGVALSPDRHWGIFVVPGEQEDSPLQMFQFSPTRVEPAAQAHVFATPALFGDDGLAYLAQDDQEVHRLFLRSEGQTRLLAEESRARLTPAVASPDGDRVLCSRLRADRPQEFLLARPDQDYRLEPLTIPGWDTPQTAYYLLAPDGRTFLLMTGVELLVGRLP